ncbi:serine protease [Mortierella hygrophila]|uniref:Serine protease n=1 Tax=Mortierella hygrophila TaxID=979708 RepID=A0A9P6FBX6_9FUNG|nr:serine protease [Mortierella hygrophila]
MKVACLLPLPLLLVPFTHAADYLVRFKEGTPAPATQQNGVSRIETFSTVQPAGGASQPRFDYHSNVLALTVLSLSQAKALATHGDKSKQRHGKSKAQVETTATAEAIGEGEAAIQIKSKGRWFTFDDSEFHVWHGDFSEAEAKLLAQDAGVEMVEKDMVIRFPELEQYNNQAATAFKAMNLEQAYSLVDEHLSALELKTTRKKAGEKDAEVHIPNIGEKESSSRHKSSKKVHLASELVQPVTAEDIPGPNNAYTIQQNAPSWGLPRVSQRTLPLHTDYLYPNSAGQGVDIYVIDTGINIHHVDFEGRARWGVTTVPGAPNTDDNGHGTFVAGVIGSRTFGIAKKVNLIAVKGLNKEGTSTLSQILAALDWVIKQNASSSNHRNVVNLSLGAGYSKVLNSAVDALVQSGLFIVAAAGNGNEYNIGQNACNYSPASAPSAFTVGSTNISDQMSSFSNYGPCVNIYAPGERVRSTWIGPTNREIYTDSGTSFSAPNVAGIAALVMSAESGDRSDGSWSPKGVGNRILQLGTRNVIHNFKGPANTNLLAFNGAGIIGIGSNNNSNNGNNNGGQGGGDNNNGGTGGGGDNGPKAPPFGSNTTTPLVNGAASVSSISNHGPTLSVLQTLTILSTVGATFVTVVFSL